MTTSKTEFSGILANIARHISLEEEEADYFVSLLRNRRVRKKEVLLNAGQPCLTINYVNKGALRAFYSDQHASESTIMFAVADWWITDMPCFVNKSAAMTTIEALEESTVLELSRENFDGLFIKVPKFERFFRILMQNSYIREQLRVLQNLSLSAEERYNNFLGKYPAIAQRITQKQIASYLGITPEFLSAIRKNMGKGIS